MDAPLHLHLNASAQIIANYLCVETVSIEEALAWVRRLAIVPSGPAERHLVAELEAATGMSITDLAAIAKKWLPKG